MKKITILIFTASLAGCTTFPEYALEPFEESYWDNRDLVNVSPADFRFEFSKAKGECNVQAYSHQIPSPSCSTIPASSCIGLTGFALGLCLGQQPYQTCDYSSVNAAKNAQDEIFKNCMIAKGWSMLWKKGQGTDNSGGLFEKISDNGNIEFYLKPTSIIQESAQTKAIVRMINKTEQQKSYQGYLIFDKNDNTFRFDDAPKQAIPKGSAAELVFKRIEDLK